MKTNLVRAALACAALALTSAAAMAAQVDVFLQLKGIVVDRNTGAVAAEAWTDAHGQMTFSGLRPGDYVLRIDGASLDAAMDRLNPPPPAKTSGGSSLSIGGNLFGGGSSHSSSGHQGAAINHEEQDSKHTGERAMAVGVDIPVGGADRREDKAVVGDIPMLKIELTGILISGLRKAGDVDGRVSFEAPYCRASGGGISVGFTVPPSTGPAEENVVLTIRKAGGTL